MNLALSRLVLENIYFGTSPKSPSSLGPVPKCFVLAYVPKYQVDDTKINLALSRLVLENIYFGTDTKIYLTLARLVLEDILFWHRYKNLFNFGKISFGGYFISAPIPKWLWFGE